MTKMKLVLKRLPGDAMFRIVKSVNTLKHGIPGGTLTREEVDTILKSDDVIRRQTLTVEILD